MTKASVAAANPRRSLVMPNVVRWLVRPSPQRRPATTRLLRIAPAEKGTAESTGDTDAALYALYA
jgi:hypothetical protein